MALPLRWSPAASAGAGLQRRGPLLSNLPSYVGRERRREREPRERDLNRHEQLRQAALLKAAAAAARRIRLSSPAELHPLLVSLRCVGVPADFLALVSVVLGSPNLQQGICYDAVEFFAGDMAYTKAHQERGRAAAAYEIKYGGDAMDMNSATGYALAVALMTSVRPGGAALFAPVCSSWVFMNRGTSMRTFAAPLGAPGSAGVQEANLMVSRVVLLLAIAWVKGLFVIWEQPQNSLMEQHPRMQDPTILIGCLRFPGPLGFDSLS